MNKDSIYQTYKSLINKHLNSFCFYTLLGCATIMKVEIGFYSKYPMEIIPKYERFEAKMIVLEGKYDTPNYNHKLNKKVIRKKSEDAYKIAKKWNDEALAKGWKVRPSLGNVFNAP